MAQDRSFLASNAQETRRLKALAARITDAELAQEIEGNWTVAIDFAHLAFWDRRLLAQIEYWEHHGVTDSPYNADVFNDALLPIFLALPPRAAVQLAVESAGLVDQKLESLPDEFLAAVRSLPNPPNLDRGRHRREHLAQLERIGIQV
ncbi:MAG: DinB family protein [Anaerolineales bacterium]|nr:DinB family protein [Anaerolineales bacterium]